MNFTQSWRPGLPEGYLAAFEVALMAGAVAHTSANSYPPGRISQSAMAVSASAPSHRARRVERP
jgi:hypothetical protein